LDRSSGGRSGKSGKNGKNSSGKQQQQQQQQPKPKGGLSRTVSETVLYRLDDSAAAAAAAVEMYVETTCPLTAKALSLAEALPPINSIMEWANNDPVEAVPAINRLVVPFVTSPTYTGGMVQKEIQNWHFLQSQSQPTAAQQDRRAHKRKSDTTVNYMEIYHHIHEFLEPAAIGGGEGI
jgi:hypothetical protein